MGKGYGERVEMDKVGGWWVGKVGDFWFYSRVGDAEEIKDFTFFYVSRGNKEGQDCFEIFCVAASYITASVTKSYHQDCGPCYLQLPIFFFHMYTLLFCDRKKIGAIVAFLSKLDHRPIFFDYIYLYIYMYLYNIIYIYIYIYR